MKKRLLFSFVALLCAISSFAQHQSGDYIYTTDARYKLTGSNLLSTSVGTFTDGDGFGGWNLIDGSADYSEFAEVGSGLKWTNSLATNGIVTTVEGIAPGFYIVAFKMYNEDNGFTSQTGTGKKNYIQVIANMAGGEAAANDDGSAVDKSSGTIGVGTSEDEYYIMVNIQNPWNDKLNIVLGGLLENTVVTGIEVWQAEQVYDIRALDKYFEKAEMYMTGDDYAIFQENTKALEKLQGTVNEVKALLETPEMFDDLSVGEFAESMLADGIIEFLDATAQDVSSFFKATVNGQTYTGFDFANWAFVSRGKFANNNGPNVYLQGDHWGHLKSGDTTTSDPTALTSRVQGNQDTNASAFNLYQADFPQGKYYFTAEVRASATSNSDTWPCANAAYDTESMCQFFINNEVTDVPVMGLDWTKVTLIGETPDDEAFHVGVFWTGPNSDCTMEIIPNQPKLTITRGPRAGGLFDIRNVEVRAFFDGDFAALVNRTAYFKDFKAQYDAIISAREAALAVQADAAAYPYRQDSLAAAFAQWDPYYNKMIGLGWVDAEGKDTNVATDKELQDFVKMQGVWDNADEATSDYPVSRGYQNATAYVKAAIAHFTTLDATLKTAKQVHDNPMYATGEISTFEDAIKAAQEIYDNTLAAASDASYVADSTVVMSVNETLLAAIEDFKNSADLDPFLEFRFNANEDGTASYTTIYGAVDAETGEPTVEAYEIPATVGDFKMTFATPQAFAGSGVNYWLGPAASNDALIIGNTEAVIDFSKAGLTADDVLRLELDLWGGKEDGDRHVLFGIRNAEGDRLGGIKWDVYHRTIDKGYNDFYDGKNGINLFDSDKVGTVGSSSAQNEKIHAKDGHNHFILLYDAKGRTLVGENWAKESTKPSSGDLNGQTFPMVENANGDYVPAVFYVGSENTNAARRSWIDNITMVKYKSGAEATGIYEVTPVSAKTLNGTLYNVAGQAVGDNFKGIVIKNGKKYIK